VESKNGLIVKYFTYTEGGFDPEGLMPFFVEVIVQTGSLFKCNPPQIIEESRPF
jgi:hypothetical protein